MFYRHNKTFWYQFCNFKHFLKAENSDDSVPLEPQNPYPSLRVILAEKGTHY